MSTPHRTTRAALVVLAACAVEPRAFAGDCPELAGRLPGPFSAVAVSGGHAYLAESAGLSVADVSDPAAPRWVSEVAMVFGAMDVAVSGGYAYVAGIYGLSVLDLSLPSEPVEVGFQWLPRGEDNSAPVESDPITLPPGHGARLENARAARPGAGGSGATTRGHPHSLGASACRRLSRGGGAAA